VKASQENIQPVVSQSKPWILALVSFIVGLAVCGLLIVKAMPGMMIVTHECQHDFDGTLNKLQDQINAQGWVVVGGKPSHMNDSLAKKGVDFSPRVSLVKMCQPEYAKSVLTTDRHVACLMPCSVAVWEGNDGKTYLSKMNVGLMGKLFGGNVARVMGGDVARDEAKILAGLLKP
jgi:uncharacterized protein (DUF302 family)